MFLSNRPLHALGFSEAPPKTVFGQNLRYMAPFDFSRAVFCVGFQRASFVFSCLGADFGGRGRILDPQVDILGPGTFFV